jgi:hypothetical protein
MARLKILLFLALCFQFAFGEANFPEVETDRDIVELLVRAQDYIPGLFSNPDNVKADYFQIIETTRGLADTFEDNSDYAKLLKTRGQELLITVKPKIEGEPLPTVNSEELRKLKQDWENSTKGLPKNATLKEVLAGFQKAQVGTSQGLLTGLIQTLPGPKRGAVFKMPFADQVKTLQKELSEDVIQAGFRVENFGLKMDTLSKKDALQLLVDKKTAETSLDALLATDSLLTLAGKGSKNLSVMKENLSGLTAKSLEQAVKNNPKDLGPSSFPPELKSALERAEKRLRSVIVPPKQNTEPVAETITVQEAPPWAALFRGCAGGDCSTGMSYPYTLSPTDRFFYVRDAQGAVKGYVHGIVASLEGKKSFYVHTISGPRISKKNVIQIFQGLDAAKKDLGVREIALTDGGGGRINYQEIENEFGMLAKQSKAKRVSMVANDSKIRSVLDTYATSDYDAASSHKWAYPLRIPKEKILDVDVEIKKADPSYKPKKKATSEELFLLTLDFFAAGREDMAERIARTLGKSSAKAGALWQLLENEDEKKTKDFLQKVQSAFTKSGITADEAFLAKRQHLLLKGLRSSPDVTESKYINPVIDKFFSELRNSDCTWDFATSHIDKLLGIPRFRRQLLDYLSDPNTDGWHEMATNLGAKDKARVYAELIPQAGEEFFDWFDSLNFTQEEFENILRELARVLDKRKDTLFDRGKFAQRLIKQGVDKELVATHFPTKPKENLSLKGPIVLQKGDSFITPGGLILKVSEVLHFGERSSTYKVESPNGTFYHLAMAGKDPEGFALRNIARTEEYKEHELQHLPIAEKKPFFTLKELPKGKMGSESFAEDVPSKAKEAAKLSLGNFLAEWAARGIYVGHIEPKDLFWDGQAWNLIQSGSIETEIDPTEAAAKYQKAFEERWDLDLSDELSTEKLKKAQKKFEAECKGKLNKAGK